MNRDPTFSAREFSSQFLTLTEISDLLCLSFPKKLWKIVESNHFKSISWNDNGDCVIIEEELFQKEILDRKGLIRIFETSSLKSFIRQLNLYGFSKIRLNLPSSHSPQGTDGILIYRNSNFRRDCPFLLQRMKRRVGIRNGSQSGSVPSLPKRKRTRVLKRQLNFRESKMTLSNSKRVVAKKGKKRMLKKPRHAQKKTKSHDYGAPPAWPLENSAGHPRQNQPQVHPREPPNIIGSNPFIAQEPTVPTDPATMGLPPLSFYPDFTSINAQITALMSLYNPWFAMFMAAASTMPLSEPSEQQVSSSAQPCPICNCYNNEPSSKSVTSQSPHSSSD